MALKPDWKLYYIQSMHINPFQKVMELYEKETIRVYMIPNHLFDYDFPNKKLKGNAKRNNSQTSHQNNSH